MSSAVMQSYKGTWSCVSLILRKERGKAESASFKGIAYAGLE